MWHMVHMIRILLKFMASASPFPKGPYTAHLKTLVPNTIPGIVFGTRVLKWAVYGVFGFVLGPCRLAEFTGPLWATYRNYGNKYGYKPTAVTSSTSGYLDVQITTFISKQRGGGSFLGYFLRKTKNTNKHTTNLSSGSQNKGVSVLFFLFCFWYLAPRQRV